MSNPERPKVAPTSDTIDLVMKYYEKKHELEQKIRELKYEIEENHYRLVQHVLDSGHPELLTVNYKLVRRIWLHERHR